jgi:hypothetical protein
MVIKTKFKGITSNTAKPITIIHASQNPTVSCKPAIVSMDKYNNCKVIIENCAPYDITLARNEILGVFKLEHKQCLPLSEQTISAMISFIHQKFPKVPKKKFSKTEIE